MRMLTGVLALCLGVLVTSCASASPPQQAETEYITQFVEIRPAMTAALAADPALCPAIRPAENADLTDGYIHCATLAAANAGQVSGLQRLIEDGEAVPPDR